MLPSDNRLLTPVEVAELLGVSVQTVGRWLREGVLPGYRLGVGPKGRVRVRLGDVEGFVVPLRSKWPARDWNSTRLEKASS
jgi:excisionase family DNA binding protein